MSEENQVHPGLEEAEELENQNVEGPSLDEDGEQEQPDTQAEDENPAEDNTQEPAVTGFRSGDAESVKRLQEAQAAERAAEVEKAREQREQSAEVRLARRRQSFKQLSEQGTITVGRGQPRLRDEPEELPEAPAAEGEEDGDQEE